MAQASEAPRREVVGHGSAVATISLLDLELVREAGDWLDQGLLDQHRDAEVSERAELLGLPSGDGS